MQSDDSNKVFRNGLQRSSSDLPKSAYYGEREGAGNDFETDGRLGMMSKSSTRGFPVPQPNPYRSRKGTVGASEERLANQVIMLFETKKGRVESKPYLIYQEFNAYNLSSTTRALTLLTHIN